MEKFIMPFIGFTKSATKKEGLLTWVANVAGAIIPIAPVKASLTRTQFEPANRFKCTFSHSPNPSSLCTYHFTKKGYMTEIHHYQWLVQTCTGINLLPSMVGAVRRDKHIFMWCPGLVLIQRIAHTCKFIVLCNNDKTRLRRMF